MQCEDWCSVAEIAERRGDVSGPDAVSGLVFCS